MKISTSLEKQSHLRETIPPIHKETQFEKYTSVELVRFASTTNEEVKQMIHEFGVKRSGEDPIPAALISSSIDELLPVYADW